MYYVQIMSDQNDEVCIAAVPAAQYALAEDKFETTCEVLYALAALLERPPADTKLVKVVLLGTYDSASIPIKSREFMI